MSYKVPFVDLPAQYRRLEKEIMPVIRDVMLRGDFMLRRDLRQFEEHMASFLGLKYVVGVGSGTDAIHLALRAAGIGQGDEVITVGFTCTATLTVIVHAGATPVLVDVSEDYNMNVNKVEKAITPKTRAILPVHLNGRVCDMERLMDIASRHNLLVIEDAAQAIGAGFNGRKAGSFGQAGCFSVYPMKLFGALGDGGFVATDDKVLAERVFQLRDLGQCRETGETLYFGFSSRLDNIQAAILDVKLKYLPAFIERRREGAALYHQLLSDLPYLKLPPPPDMEGHYYDVFQNYLIRTEQKDKLVAYLTECGIETLTSWYLSRPLHYNKALNLSHFHLPNTEQFAGEAVSLPLNAEISDEQVEYVAASIREFYVRQG